MDKQDHSLKAIVVAACLAISSIVSAQGTFPPQVGEPGSDAIHKDSTCFRDWAISCTVSRGFRQINLPDSGYADAGSPVYATGKSNLPQVVSLGDGGVAILQFAAPFFDGEGPDFAVFENGFGQGSEAFLELAFVEVSSDGEHFFRFPAISNIQVDTQTQSFGFTDASYLHNLAGKFIAHYGVPFDLADLADTILLDKQRITHVRIVDVIGSIDPNIGSHDTLQHLINDPWPTNFGGGGFDLDAVGIIHSTIPLYIRDAHSQHIRHTSPQFDVLGRLISPSQEGYLHNDAVMIQSIP
jgi:hypothetical protein